MTRHLKICFSCQKTAPVPKTKTPSSGTLWSGSKIHVDTIDPPPQKFKKTSTLQCSASLDRSIPTMDPSSPMPFSTDSATYSHSSVPTPSLIPPKAIISLNVATGRSSIISKTSD
ncbi:hypothetical protein RCL1_001313 [Eukaryota sp. TZLM3-RCL]